MRLHELEESNVVKFKPRKNDLEQALALAKKLPQLVGHK